MYYKLATCYFCILSIGISCEFANYINYFDLSQHSPLACCTTHVVCESYEFVCVRDIPTGVVLYCLCVLTDILLSCSRYFKRPASGMSLCLGLLPSSVWSQNYLLKLQDNCILHNFFVLLFLPDSTHLYFFTFALGLL